VTDEQTKTMERIPLSILHVSIAVHSRMLFLLSHDWYKHYLIN